MSTSVVTMKRISHPSGLFSYEYCDYECVGHMNDAYVPFIGAVLEKAVGVFKAGEPVCVLLSKMC